MRRFLTFMLCCFGLLTQAYAQSVASTPISSTMTATLNQCQKVDTVCVEPGGTRVINGANITKACWKYRDVYDCVGTTPATDNCTPLRASAACQQINSVCKQTGFNGECLAYTNTFNCGTQTAANPTVIQLTETFTIVQDTLNVSQCTALATNPKCQKTGQVCTEPGGTRVINGLPVTKDCWAYQDTYSCVNLTNTCGDLKARPECSLLSDRCSDTNPDGSCSLKEYQYKCSTGSTTTPVTSCTGGLTCTNGLCFTNNNTADNDFSKALTQMEVGRQAAGYARNGMADPKFFSGHGSTCSKNALHSCCTTNTKGSNASNHLVLQAVMQGGKQAFGSWYVYDMTDDTVRNSANAISAVYSKFTDPNTVLNFEPTGITLYGVTFNPFAAGGIENMFAFDPTSFAIQIGLQILQAALSCNQDEEVLAMKRGQKLCTYVGSYCQTKVLGVCLSRREKYCCFNSVLARIVNTAGRGQLGKSWGTPENTDCSGFSADEFKQIDFAQIDLSEFTAEIMSHMNLPTAATSGTASTNANTINTKMNNYFNNPNRSAPISSPLR